MSNQLYMYDPDNRRDIKGNLSADMLPLQAVHETLTVLIDGQTSFTLFHTVAYPNDSELVLNGVRMKYGSGYIINESLLLWIHEILLETTDELTIDYTRLS